MPQFLYKAKDQSGKPVEGVIEAEGRPAVIARLQQMGYFPVSIEQGVRRNGKVVPAPAAGGGGGGAAAATTSLRLPQIARIVGKAGAKKIEPKPKAEKQTSLLSFRRRRITISDMASFNRQLADLLGAGVPLVKSLTILARQMTNDRFSEIVSQINADVQDGATLADALAKHPKLFSKLYVAMVRSGETGGNLDEVLKRLADYSEQEEQLRGRIKAALAYPAVMIIAGTGAVIVMFSYVVPKIVATFRELNQTLPPMTQLLISISDFMQAYWYFVVGGIVAGAMGFWRFVNTDEGRAMWHRVQLRIPLFGDLVKKREVSRFARTLGSLLKNGVPILTALAITRDVLNNTLAKQEVSQIIEDITQGASIAVPLKNSQIFPSVTINMMTVGEETGQLENVLLRISDSYELEVDRRVRTLTSLIEPLIIVVMAFIVGFIVISMLLPIFSLDPSGGAGL